MTLFERVFGGNDAVYGLTEAAINNAIAQYGEGQAVSFPGTAYSLPCYYGVTGVKVETLGQLKEALGVVKTLMTRNNRLNDAFMSGVATALCAEFIEVLKYIGNDTPYEAPCYGHLPDAVVRSLGVPLVTGDIPGVPVILGTAPTADEAVALVKSYQSQGMLVTLVGGIIDQLQEKEYKTGDNVRVIPLGKDVTSVIHVVSVAVRAALIFGNIQPGDLAGLLDYTKNRVPAFVNTFGAIDAVVVSAGAGAIALGFPVVVDIDLGENQVPGALESVCDHAETVKKSLELRGIKIKTTELPIPVAFAAAFEGEIIRKADMHNECWSAKNPTAELVLMREMNEVEDHKITIIGPDFDQEKDLALATFVEVAGKKMQTDFESVIERKFHSWFNYMEGVMHTGQRNQVRVRVSNAAFEAGLRIKDFAEVLYVMIMNEFDAVVDKCQVTIITDAAEAAKFRDEVAMPRYDARDDRLASMTDEAVDRYYTCILCQSFAPAHCCVVTPERLGLCGAVSWLDAKATNELNPNGPCQPIFKEGCTDERLGAYESVNEAVSKYSHGALERVTLYSILEDPMTSCGCFECICGIEPMSNGVVITNREHVGMTPLGMSFSEMASMTGGGVQTPGFMGHGKQFISSKKFIAAEGGPGRIVWMPKELKDQVRERLNATAKEMYDVDDFTDMIADETVCTEDPEELMNFLAEKGHPVLSMEPFDM